MSEEKVLTKDIAEQFLEDQESVDLPEFTAIEDDAAGVLASHRGDLYLEGLTTLSEVAATLLGSHTGGELSLSALDCQSDSVVQLLAKHKDELVVGLTTLTDAMAVALVEQANNCEGVLSLPCLATLSDTAAGILATYKGVILNLHSLTTLTDAAAEALANYEGEIYLFSLATLSDNAAESLAKHKGTFSFCEEDLSAAVAKILVNREADTKELCLDRTSTLSDVAAEALAKFDGHLYLDGLTAITDTAATALATHKGFLSLNGLTTLSAAAAELLAKHDGDLHLVGLTAITDAAAEGLSKHRGGVLSLSLDISLAVAKTPSGCGVRLDIDLSNFLDQPDVFSTLRRHPSLVARVLRAPPQWAIALSAKDIDRDEGLAFADDDSQFLYDNQYFGNPVDDGCDLLQRAAGRPVWRLSLSDIKDHWWFWDHPEERAVYLIGDQSEVIGRIDSLPDAVFTEELAELLLDNALEYREGMTDSFPLVSNNALKMLYGYDFNGEGLCVGVKQIDEELAEVIGGFSHSKLEYIRFTKAPTVTVSVAEKLLNYRGTLCFDRVANISDAEAGAFSKHEGEGLRFDALTTLSDVSAKCFSGYRGHLGFDGLATLSDNCAELLSRHEGSGLSLFGLTALSNAAAESLARYKGDLNLANSLETLLKRDDG